MNNVFMDGDVGKLVSDVKFQNKIRFYIFGLHLYILNGIVSSKIYDKE